jgi:hypothetical protein
MSLSMDVRVDTHDFCPWHFDEIQAVMNSKADARALFLARQKCGEQLAFCAGTGMEE